MITPEIDVRAASRIITPSGRDYERCLEAFEAEFDVNAPRFNDRRLTLRSENGTLYTKVKGKDVPAYVANGSADIGLTGTDVCEEQIPEKSNLLYRAIGEPMCTFSLLLPDDEAIADTTLARLENPEADPVQVATSYPRFLWRCVKRAREAGRALNITVDSFKPSGSVEALPGWTTEAVADIVETGETAEANGLRKGPELAVVSPAVVWRDPNKSPAPLNRSFYSVDTALEERVRQATDPTLSSYTIERLRNPNQAVKDYGEETAEFLDAVIRGSDSAANELADLIFAGLVLSRANGGQVTLAEVTQILETRNGSSSLKRKI
jgi:ATP phosphoribosyltransferase